MSRKRRGTVHRVESPLGTPSAQPACDPQATKRLARPANQNHRDRPCVKAISPERAQRLSDDVATIHAWFEWMLDDAAERGS
ncbi:MAG: hypothetical protein L0Y44_09265 [Phycisphaerales bacterium]|nr:hypothetical protein [Phycisphaerales bacterium]